MRTNWRRRAAVLGATSLLALVPSMTRANGHGRLATTEYVEALPTTYLSAVPTAYVATGFPLSLYSTSYEVVPTSYDAMPTAYLAGPAADYYAPTVYAPTTYVESAYPLVATTYRRRPLFPRLRGYRATSYAYSVPALAATSYEVAYAEPAAEACCAPASPCDTGYAPMPQAAASVVPPAGPPVISSEPPPKSVKSEPGIGPVQSSAVNPAPTVRRETAVPQAAAPAKAKPAAVDPNVASPPSAPAAEKDGTGATPITPVTPAPAPVEIESTPAEEIKPPLAPTDAPNPVKGAVFLYNARRPVLTAAVARPFVRSTRDGSLNVLEGKVVAGATGLPEGGVRVTATNRAKTFADRVDVSDDRGHYAFRLPDGDWTVSVTTNSGKVYPVSELVVSDGQIVDDAGRDVPSLTITR